MKYIPWIVAAVVVLAVIFRKQIGKFFGMNGAPPPAEGSECTADGKKGTIKNGTCVVVDIVPPADQVIRIVPTNWYRYGSRRVRCYSKSSPGVSCSARILDNTFGWGTLYSETSTTCCYIF